MYFNTILINKFIFKGVIFNFVLASMVYGRIKIVIVTKVANTLTRYFELYRLLVSDDI